MGFGSLYHISNENGKDYQGYCLYYADCSCCYTYKGGDVMNESGWGGKRSGAGRPKGTTKEVSNQRPQHQVRAFDDEWEIIKAFATLVKKDKEKAMELMETINK